MDGKKVAALCVLGFLGTAFIGYCIYFDRKRRSHPEYKRRVLKKRRSTMRQNSQQVIDLSNPKVRDQFLASEFENANQKMMEGKMEEAVGHFINFIQFSSNPKVALTTLQQILPPAIFNIIIQAFAAMAKAQEGGGGAGAVPVKDSDDVD